MTQSKLKKYILFFSSLALCNFVNFKSAYSSQKSSDKETLETCGDFSDALTKSFNTINKDRSSSGVLEEILSGSDHASTHVGKVGKMSKGQKELLGFQYNNKTNDRYVRLRVDYDPKPDIPVKGAHLNLEIGKGDTQKKYAFMYNTSSEVSKVKLNPNSEKEFEKERAFRAAVRVLKVECVYKRKTTPKDVLYTLMKRSELADKDRFLGILRPENPVEQARQAFRSESSKDQASPSPEEGEHQEVESAEAD